MAGGDGRSAVRGAARGAIGAMSMSGLRQATTALGMIGRTPPQSILERTAPGLLRRVPPERRPALLEAVHCAVGAAGGLAFGALPRRVRRMPWAGPLYGVLFWAGFQALLAPALGIHREHHGTAPQLAELADHILYGTVVGVVPVEE
ncbi:hypothetical protein ACFFWC_02545 [Plantactinospora siamensis]|uniref:DUF1440 domain-containing protein n=1 Tax=Plantactinospora siamensis TaxID=555372 RepID=A0ABV6NST7_9ACTN